VHRQGSCVRPIWLLLVFLWLLPWLSGCALSVGGAGGGGDDTPPYTPPDEPTPPPAGSVSPLFTLFADGSGRTEPEQFITYWLTAPSGEILYRARLRSDTAGQLPPVPIAYELGVSWQAGTPTFTEGVYRLHWQPEGGTEQTRDYTVSELWHRLYACDASGDLKHWFSAGAGTLSCHLEHFPVNQTVDLYLVADRNDWSEDEPLVDVTGAPHEVATGSGNLVVQLVSGLAPGCYDLVADLDRNGKYTSRDILCGLASPALVVGASRGTGQAVQLACDSTGQPRQAFETGETIYCAFAPVDTSRLAGTSNWLTVYCVPHKAEWTSGLALQDAGAGAELLPLQPDSRWLACTPIAAADLPSGVYDLVLDIDNDGLYTEGIDVVDNLDVSGSPSGGFVVGEAPPAEPPVPEPPVTSADFAACLTWEDSDNLDLSVVSPSGKWCNVWLSNPGEGLHHLGDATEAGQNEWITLDPGAGSAGTYGVMVSRRFTGGSDAKLYLDLWLHLGQSSEQHYRLKHLLPAGSAAWKATGILLPDGDLVAFPAGY